MKNLDVDFRPVVQHWIMNRNVSEMTILMTGNLPSNSVKELVKELCMFFAKDTIKREHVPLSVEEMLEEMLEAGFVDKVEQDVCLAIQEEMDIILNRSEQVIEKEERRLYASGAHIC